ncbi:MAG: SAM-dependent chlorinase/fluorinase [Bacteroidetes bacterium]|nr:SAM-dependent chlorinase/fluorinase [Bacteroidota bacterium]
MPVITLTTDFGLKDHYMASVKGALIGKLPNTHIIDISHQVPAFDFAQAAFILSRAFPEFPAGSIHIISVNSGGGPFDHVAIRLHKHFFIGCDNGIFSLLSNEEEPSKIILLAKAGEEPSTFAARDIYVPAAIKLANGIPLEKLGTELDRITQRIRPVAPPENDVLKGTIVHIDNFGNLITDITGDEFDRIGKGRLFTIDLTRDEITELSRTYSDVPQGEKLAFFNSSGVLEIAMNLGKASGLLNMKIGTVIRIRFE